MTRSISRWITTLSTAAALGVPAMGMAQTPTQQTPPQQQTEPQQTPPAQQPPAQSRPTEQPPAAVAPDADKALTPQEHLSKAKAALDKVQPTSLTGPAKVQFTELKRHLIALEGIDASKAAGRTASPAARPNVNWGTEAAAIDKILASLLGDSATGTTGVPGAPGAAGTAGATGAKAPALDEATRAALMDVRKHVVAYATGMAGAAPAPKDDAAAPKSDAPMTPSSPSSATPEQQPPATPPSAATPSAATPSAATPSAATPATPPSSAAQSPAAQPSATPSAQPVDQEAARRHLVAARESLTQLTKLPAAAQLAGESRTQVTQLIANFNELITTQSQWRSSYAKVAANLTAVLGPDNSDAEATGGVPTTTAGTTPAPGAVGTSGAAMDPAVRGKLVELRRHLTEFEKAMGGPAL